VFLLVPAQDKVGAFLSTFKEYPSMQQVVKIRARSEHAIPRTGDSDDADAIICGCISRPSLQLIQGG
jgi:hypothetical protein